MSFHAAEQLLLLNLKKLYDDRESATIMHWVMEHITGKKKTERIIHKTQPLTTSEQETLQRILQELMAHRPLQYVLGEAWFAGMKFYVNEQVLIPRPETEELVEWVVAESQKSKAKNQKILDIGTGSGCIPIALKKKLPEYDVTTIDISEGASNIAIQNAASLQVDIKIVTVDFLDENNWDQLPVFDMIVSNPPYIKVSEKQAMAKNVLDYEPGIALFVPDNDPLLFYRKITLFAKKHLAHPGSIFLEINEAHGKEVISLYSQDGFTTEIKKDLQEKDRMIKATNT